MKWRTFDSRATEFFAKRRQWHPWFAWYPVVIEGFAVPTSGVKLSPDEWILFETIDRSADRSGNWQYRLIKESGEQNG
jgi:hypothetical protein